MNRCCFANEEGKMPEQPKHPNCRCKANAKDVPKAGDVTLEFPMEKIKEYLFVKPDKAESMKVMGYTIEDAEYVHKELARQGKEQYAKGNYEIREHRKYGISIRMPVTLRGKGEASRLFYYFYTGWTIYPNFELKNNTPFAAWQNEKNL